MSTPSTDHQEEPATFWDRIYAERRDGAEPRVNPLLAEVAADLAPGAALDLGCGAGGDTHWLASRGWRVTAVDISEVATGRLAERARAAGLAGLITAERHNLAETFPAGEFDLISAQYLHTPFALDRAAALRTASRALRQDGLLLVVDHGSIAPWSWNQDQDTHFTPPQEIAAGLDLDPASWRVERAEQPRRIATGPTGETAEVVDHVLLVRRIG